MGSPKYKLTNSGKFVCVLLVLMIVVSLYFVADRYWLKDDKTAQHSQEDGSGAAGESGTENENNPSKATSKEPDNPDSSGSTDDSKKPDGVLNSADAVKHITIYFDPDSSVLTSDAKKTLNQFIEDTTALSDHHVLLEANCATVLQYPFSDVARTEHQALAETRGNAVARYLTENRMKVTEVINFGAENPKNNNSTFESRSQNRRVDVYLYQ